jgi:hypothetical protein
MTSQHRQRTKDNSRIFYHNAEWTKMIQQEYLDKKN